jgi:hypothetical protein
VCCYENVYVHSFGSANVCETLVVRTSLIFLGGLWLALLGGGTAWMMQYGSTAGSSDQAPVEWPVASQLRRVPGKATLMMFAHPKCPCTRASMEELAALMAESPGEVTAQVVFFKPENAGDDWPRTALWRTAAAIPGVTVSIENAGAEARRFGAETSGDVLLYDARGRLAFHGGITAVRGEAGPNAGHAALADFLAGKEAPQTRAPVFGCPLTASRTCPVPLPRP